MYGVIRPGIRVVLLGVDRISMPACGKSEVEPVMSGVRSVDDRRVEIVAVDHEDAGLAAVLRGLEAMRADALDLAVGLDGDDLHGRKLHCSLCGSGAECSETQ